MKTPSLCPPPCRAGSVGRIVFPLFLVASGGNYDVTLYIAVALSALCVPLLLTYIFFQRRRNKPATQAAPAADSRISVTSPPLQKEVSMAVLVSKLKLPGAGADGGTGSERTPLL
jgi:hypothetical protein